jgi:DNA recombination protein RmuC
MTNLIFFISSLLVLFSFWLFLKSRRQFEETLKALSERALEKNQASFFELASELFHPVQETIHRLDVGLQSLEKERKGDHASIRTQLQALQMAEKELRFETSNLVKALRAPLTRGRWGEIQLRRVVELAGMLNHCDFFEQQQEKEFRPDLLVRLPAGRQIVIDAKVPLEAYLDAIQEQDDKTKQFKFKEHARQVRAHIFQLSKKAYWEQFQPTPEFVILFLPSETIFSAALEHDPTLIEIGAEEGVIIATPSTLIALLRTVAYGWKQENLSAHAQKVSDLAHDLYKRLLDMSSHFSKMGRSLTSAVEAYNKGVGSLEARVLPVARKFQDLGAASSSLEIEPLEGVDKIPRELQAPELTEAGQIPEIEEI